MAGAAPVFAAPKSIDGLTGTWTWSSQGQNLNGNVHAGQTYTESVAQPNPTDDQLASAKPATSASQGDTDELALPPDVPASVRSLVSGIVNGKDSAYAKARAISDYFHNPANGFGYSLQTKGGESSSDLVDFLNAKVGYCQQYAAAAAVMMRIAGVPARVVLGYTHTAPNASGQFTVTTDDAHAWVEADFEGLGWIPFDPTPLTGSQAARAVSLPWAPQASASAVSTAENPHQTGSVGVAGQSASLSASSAGASATSRHSDRLQNVIWVVVGLVITLLIVASLIPAAIRMRRRRRWLRLGSRGRIDLLWDELRDTAVDLELGWTSARTPRQVADWLREMALAPAAGDALRELAAAVEVERYARPDHAGSGTDRSPALRVIRHALTQSSTAGQRWRARLLPASVVPRLAAAARCSGHRGRYQGGGPQRPVDQELINSAR